MGGRLLPEGLPLIPRDVAEEVAVALVVGFEEEGEVHILEDRDVVVQDRIRVLGVHHERIVLGWVPTVVAQRRD